jgi:hypothetical protein
VRSIPKLEKLVADYEKARTQLDDLSDQMLCSIRKKKAPKRKQARRRLARCLAVKAER